MKKTINTVSAPNGLSPKHNTVCLKVGKMIQNVILKQNRSIFSSFLKKTFSINEGIAGEVREADFENASEVGADWMAGRATKAAWQEL